MGQYEVTSSVLADTIEFEDGDMNKFSLSLRDRDSGNVLNDVAQWRPASSRQGGFPEGAIIEADVKNQPRGGLKLANAKLIEQPSSNGSQAQGQVGEVQTAPDGSKTEVRDYRRDPVGQSIERQVALKVAGEISQAGDSPQAVVDRAKVFADWLANPVDPADDIPF
jgi:hypothetical protein